MNQAINNQTGRLVLAAHPHLGIPALYVHDLTGTPDAVRLLGTPPPIHPQTSQVLPRLRQFNPEIASKLIEKDDTVKHIPFKLITANQFWIPTEIQSFVALSYCWHGNDWEIPARFNGYQSNGDFPVCPALLNAIILQCIVDSGTTSRLAIWLDQICINQQNSEEKFHVIANLDTIYRNAFAVNVLLEDVDISSEEESALDLLHVKKYEVGRQSAFHLTEFEVEKNIGNCLDASYGNALISILSKIFESRWFTRAWCRHEFMLNSNVMFTLIGRQHASITLSPSAFPQLHLNLGENDVDLHDVDLTPMFQDFSFGINNQDRDYTRDGCLFELFVQLQHLGCSYERDIISIALNVSGIRLTFNGNITRQRECRNILAMIALGAGDASVVGSEGLPIYRMDCPGHQPLIYWPRGEYERNWAFPTVISMRRICDDARIWHISPERILLDVFFLLSRPSMPPAQFKESAAELLSEFLLPGVDVENELPISILSCAFAFGFSWLDMASEYLTEFLYNTTEDQTIVSAVTSHYLRNEISTPTQSRIVLFMLYLGRCKNLFANSYETTPLAVSLNSAGTGRAILLVPKYLALGVRSGKYRIAIPAALNNAKTLSIRRLWLLEDVKTDEPALALVGRGYFIGERTLNIEEHNEVFYARNISIVGEWQDDEYSESDSSFEQLDTESDPECRP